MEKINLLSSIDINFFDQHFSLHPYAGMYWREAEMLIISDTHFGKVSHFRKAGMAVPLQSIEQNWDRLNQLIAEFLPKKLLILGDLFHSSYNVEWELFESFLDSFPNLELLLVAGNHDVLDKKFYNRAGLVVIDSLEIGPFYFTHEPNRHVSLHNIHGHVHPAALIQGYGRQRLRLPCFFFGKNYSIMPAFGNFTGMATVPVSEEDRVYVIAKSKVIAVS